MLDESITIQLLLLAVPHMSGKWLALRRSSWLSCSTRGRSKQKMQNESIDGLVQQPDPELLIAQACHYTLDLKP